MRGIQRGLLLGLVLAGMSLPLCGQAHGQTKTWSPPPPPFLNPGTIKFGRGTQVAPGGWVILVEGDKDIALSASVFDKDTLKTTDGSTTTEKQYDDKAMVNWSMNTDRAALSLNRTEKDQVTLLTPPTLMAGEPSLSFAITATPDDDPMPIPEGERGPESSRDDPPNTNAKVTINVNVIKNCPESIAQIADCSMNHAGDFPPFWLTYYESIKTYGYSVFHMKVSGGSPPNPPIPPGNWNGIFIREDLSPYPDGGGTATDDDFNGGITVASRCVASSQGFVVGTAGSSKRFPTRVDGTYLECLQPAADDLFYDVYEERVNIPILKGPNQAAGQKTVVCKHVYLCGSTVLKTGQPKNWFKATKTYANWPHPHNPDLQVTEVYYSRVAE